MKADLARFGRGFVYAWHGILGAIREERNFRFHLCASIYVYAAAILAGFDAVRFALLTLCICGVMGMELMNSAVERAVHLPDSTHWWSAGAAKDMAAGAVLVLALGALAVGGCLFASGEPSGFVRVWQGVTSSPLVVGLVLASLVAAYLFIFHFGTKQIKNETVGNDSAKNNDEQHRRNEP
ncbi:MAG: diacylglycerol kinase [Gemmiger sp.]|nr:diacylglycerol kinase [Gemmiger sp.]